MISFGSLVCSRTRHTVVLVVLRRSYALKTDVIIARGSFRYFHIVSAIAFATSISTFSPTENSNRFLWGYIRGKGSGSCEHSGGVQVLFLGSPDDDDERQADVASRATSRRRVSRVSGASVGVRDARYFKFHPGQQGALPTTDLFSSSLFSSSVTVSVFPSELPHLPLKCNHLILEVHTCGLSDRTRYILISFTLLISLF